MASPYGNMPYGRNNLYPSPNQGGITAAALNPTSYDYWQTNPGARAAAADPTYINQLIAAAQAPVTAAPGPAFQAAWGVKRRAMDELARINPNYYYGTQYAKKWLPGAQGDLGYLPVVSWNQGLRPDVNAMNLTNIGARLDTLLPSAAQQYTPEQLQHFASPEYLDWLQQRALGVIPASYSMPSAHATSASFTGWGVGTPPPLATMSRLQGYEQPGAVDPALFALANPATFGVKGWQPSNEPIVVQDTGGPMSELRQHLRQMFEGAKEWAPGGSKGVTDRRTLEQQAQYLQQMQDWLNWQPAEVGSSIPSFREFAGGEAPLSDDQAYKNWMALLSHKTETQRNAAVMNEAWQAWQPFLKKVFLPETEAGGGLLPTATAAQKEMASPYRYRMWSTPTATTTTKTWTPRFG